MRKILALIFSLIIGVALFFLVIKSIGWQGIKAGLLSFSVEKGLCILFLTFLIMVAGSWKWQEILKNKEVDLPFGKLLGFYLAGFSVMFLAPVLVWIGEIFRSYMVKKRTVLSWSQAVSSVIIDRVLEWTTNLIVIFLGGAFFLSKMGLPPKNLIIIFGGALLVLIGALFIFYFKTLKRESIAKTFGRVFNGDLDKKPLETEREVFIFFRRKNKAMWRGFLISFLRAGIMAVRTWFLISFLGKSISGFSSVSVLGFSYLAMMVPIPTALGIHEAIQVFVFQSLDLGSSVATAFTMVVRGAETIFAILGLGIFLKFGMNSLKEFIFRKD